MPDCAYGLQYQRHGDDQGECGQRIRQLPAAGLLGTRANGILSHHKLFPTKHKPFLILTQP